MKKLFFLMLLLGLYGCPPSGPDPVPRFQWTKENTDNGLVSNSVNAIAIDSHGNKWIGTDQGVVIFDGTTWTNINLSKRQVSCIAMDNSDNIWMGSDIELSQFNGNSFIDFDTTSGLLYNHVYTIFIDNGNNIWLGLVESWWTVAQRNPWLNKTGFGVSKFDGTIWKNYTTSDGLIDNAVTAIAQDSKGNYWFGSLGGVSKFDGVNWINYTTAQGLPDNYISCLAIDKHDNIWIGTMENYFCPGGPGAQRTNGGGFGVSKYDGKTWTNYSEVNGLINNDVNAIAIDKNGNLWFGTQGGVSMFDGVKWISYSESDGWINSGVNDIAIDKDGNKWFATDGGVSMLK